MCVQCDRCEYGSYDVGLCSIMLVLTLHLNCYSILPTCIICLIMLQTVIFVPASFVFVLMNTLLYCVPHHKVKKWKHFGTSSLYFDNARADLSQ